MNTSALPHRATLALALVAVLLLAACSTPAGPSASPTPSASPIPSAPASPAPSASPEPADPPSVIGWEPTAVPANDLGTAAVIILPGGHGLVAIGFDGRFGTMVWTSADGGRTWTDVTPDGFESVGIASAVVFDGKIIGVGRANTIDVDAQEAAAYISEDGLTWRTATGGADMQGQLIDVVATDDGLYAVGGVPGADAAGIWYSADGESWERTGGDFDHSFMWSITEGGPGLVAVGWRRNPEPDLAVWTSPDGVEWTLAPDPEGFEGYEATGVAQLDGTLAMVGSSLSGSEGRVWTSTDGLEWTLAEVAGGMDGGAYARTVRAVAAGFVAAGSGADGSGVVWFSADGRSWQPLGETVPEAYFHAAYPTEDGRGLLVAGVTQVGEVETGIEVRAAIWLATLGD